MSQSLARSMRRHPKPAAPAPAPARIPTLLAALAQRVEHVPLLCTELTSADLAFMALFEPTPIEDYEF